MPKGANYEYTAKLLVSAGMDEKSVQEVMKQEKRLVKLVKEEFENAFKNFGSVINDALAKVNLKPIPLDDILDVSDIMGTMGKLGDHIREEVVSGLKGATINGIDVGDIIADNIDLSDELARLKQQRKELTEEYEAIQKTIKNKTEIERINRQDISLPFKASGDIKSEAEKIRKEFLDAYDHLYDFEEEDEGYNKALLDAQEKANKMRQMYNTLNQSNDSGLADERNAYKKILHDEMSPMFDVEERFTDFSDEIIDATANLQQVRAELEKVNAEIDSITSKAKTTEGSALKDTISDAKDLEAALERIKNKKGDTYNKTKLKKIDALLGDETPEIEDSLKSLKFGYDKAVAEGQGWEEEYQWLIKFIRKYDELKTEGKQSKQLLNFEDTYNSFMQQYPEAIQALKELRVLVDNTPIVRKSDDSIKNPVADQQDSSMTSNVDNVNKSLVEQETLLSNIKKLTGYIDEEYLSAGKHLSDFLNDLQSESNELDSELKEVLSTLRLIDENGKPTFDIRQNGEDGGGTTHEGALISDDFVLIERGNYDNVKDSKLPSATKGAYDDGANVARVLDYIPSKYNGGFFDIQTKAQGKNLFKNGVISEDVVNATEEQLQQLVNAFIVAREHGFDIENGGSNIVYDKEQGFSFYDLEEMDAEDKDWWNNLSDEEKKLNALENALSVFNGENRDHTDSENDTNVTKFVDKIKQAIGKDAQFKGLNYEDVFDEVFADYGDVDSELEDELNRMLADAKADKEKSDARRTELVADLDKYGADVLSSKDADDNLQKFQETYETLKKEGLLTEELEESYTRLNQRLEERANLLRQAEGYYDDVDDELTGTRVTSVDSAEQYRKDHIKPFDDTITNMGDSGLFSDSELEKFEKISKSMEDRAKQLPFDELSNLYIDPDDISDLKELNELLEKRQKIMQTAGDTAMLQHDSNQYEEELKINQAIEERIALLKKADEDGAGGNTGTGTGDASYAEVERLTAELKIAEEHVKNLEDQLTFEKGKTDAEREQAEAEARARREAEDELARIKADAEGKKLVDNDASDDDSELIALRGQLADTENALADEISKTMTAEKEIAQYREEIDTLTKQIIDKTNADLEQLSNTLKEVRELFDSIQTGKIGTGGDIKIDINAQLSDIATEGTLSSVLGAVNSIDGKVTKGGQANNNVTPNGSGTQANNATQKKNNTFNLDKDIAIRDFLKLRAELSTAGDLKGKRNAKVNSLWSQLEGVTDSAGLSAWRKEFQKYQKGLNISNVFDKAYQSADKAAYEQLIALKKTEYDLETKMLKAKGPTEKSVYESQLNAIRELISQQKIVHKNMEYENQLTQMQEKHSANIAAIKGKQTDSANAKRQRDEDKETIRNLEKLYEQRARAKAQGDTVESARLRGEINLERAKLSNIDYDTDMKFKHAAERGSEAVAKEQKNAALKEEKQIISELIALYKKLGEVDAKAEFATDNDEWAKFATESQEIQEQIKLKEKLISVDSKLRGKFDTAWESGVNKEEESELKKLSKRYEELGKLRAEIAAAPKGEYRSGLESDLVVLEDSIEADKQRLHVNQELVTTYEKVAQATERVAQVELQRKKNKAIDKEAAALEQSLAKEELRIQQKELANSIKLQRRMAGIGDADSALNAGRKSLLSTYKMDDLSADAISQLPAVEKLTQALKELQDVRREVPANGIIDDDLKDRLNKATQEVLEHSDAVKDLIDNYKKFSGDNAIDFGATLDPDADVKQQLMNAARQTYGNKVSFKEFNAETKEATFNLKGANREVTELIVGINQADGKIKGLRGSTKQAEGFFEAMGRKAKEIASYISVMDVYYKATEWLRQGIEYVREIDSALTELKKVTDETAESYDRFLDKASQTGARIGSTISDYTNATATFAKLGYDMNTASGMAEAALVYQNVGDGVASAESAAESIISTMKGFGLEASNAMGIVDKFNEVGNNFSITSTGIGEALTRSASALAEGGNSLDESIGLITAANEVVQDPASVGTALKTLTLRLRGAKTELEEAGLEAENMATTTSSLRAKLLALTDGKVDIMLDEDTFKNSTQILREMAQVWEEMTDIEQAAALELMGGKRQANILSSIISNFDTVEEVIQSSANSAGSALRENEQVLDSIEGKIRQFKNALQAMWNDSLDSDMVKGVVEFGTVLIKVIDTLGLFGTALVAITLIKFVPWLLTTVTGVDKLSGALAKLLVSLVSVNGQSLTKYFAEQMAAMNGMTSVAGKLGVTFTSLGKTIGKFFTTTAGKLTIAVAAVAAIIAIYRHFTTTLEEQKEKFTEINNEVQSTETELKNLQTQLEEINTQIETLNSQDSLSFTEEEELERLRAQSAELERQIDLTQTLKESQQKELNNEALETAKMYEDANFETGKGKGEYQQTGATIGAIGVGAVGTKVGSAVGAAAATALAAGLGAKAGAIVGSVVPIVGTIIGGLLGAGLGALIGHGVGGAVADSKEQVGESIDTMTTRYAELKQEYEAARQAYMSNPMDKGIKEDYQEAEKALSDYQGAMSARMSELQTYYDSIDLSIYDPVEDAVKIKELRDEMNDFYDTQDKWAIQIDGKDAKTNAINRIFGENATDELKDVKKSLEEAAEAGEEISLEEAFSTAGLSTADLDAFITRLHDMGLYVYDVEQSFKQAAVSAEEFGSTELYDASKDVGSVKNDISSLTSALEEAHTQGYVAAETLKSLEEAMSGYDSWNNYAETMSSTVATVTEMEEATEALIEDLLDAKIASGALSDAQKAIYVRQLKDMGVKNAEEYINDKLMENMYRDIQASADYNEKILKTAFLSEADYKMAFGQGPVNNIDPDLMLTYEHFQQVREELGLLNKEWDELTDAEKANLGEKLGLDKEIDIEAARKIVEEYGMFLKTTDELARDYNSLVNGNVDYAKRPIKTKEEMQVVYPDFDGDMATTFDMDFGLTDAEGEIKYTIKATPILEDGTILTSGTAESELEDYIYNQLQPIIENGGTMEDVLQFDAQNKKLIINISEGQVEYDVNGLSDLDKQLDAIKQQHASGGLNAVVKLLEQETKAKETLEKVKAEQNEYQKLYGDYVKATEDIEFKTNDNNKAQKLLDAMNDPEKIAFDGSYGATDHWWGYEFDGKRYEMSYQDFKKELEKMVDTTDAEKKLDELREKAQDKGWMDKDGNWIEGIVDDMKAEVDAAKQEYEGFKNLIEEKLTAPVEIDFDAKDVAAGIESFNSAVSEANSALGMSDEAIANIESRYNDLEGFDAAALFEKTTMGVRMNTEELQKLEKAYLEDEKKNIIANLDQKKQKHLALSDAIKTETDAQKKANLIQQQNQIEKEIKNLTTLASQYDAVTSAYQRWINAQSTTDAGSVYEDVTSKLTNLEELYNDGLIGKDEFKIGVEFISGKDTSGMSSEELIATYQESMPNMKKYFTEGQEGAQRFLEDIQRINSEWASQDDSGYWTFSFDDHIKEVAEELNTSEEAIQAIRGRLIDYGATIDPTSLYGDYDALEGEFDSMVARLEKATGKKYEFDLAVTNISDIDKQIEDATGVLEEFKNPQTGEIDFSISGAKEAQAILVSLLLQKSQLESPAIVKVDTSQIEDEQVKNTIQQVIDLFNTVRDYQIKLNTPGFTQEQIDEAKQSAVTAMNEVNKTLSGGGTGEETLRTLGFTAKLEEGALTGDAGTEGSVMNLISSIEPNAIVEVGVDPKLVDGYKEENHDIPDAKVKYSPVETTQLKSFKKKNHNITGAKIEYTYVTTNSPPSASNITQANKIDSDGDGWPNVLDRYPNNKNAHARGTAFAQGNWGTKSSGTALGGELGQEIVVRDGRWFTIGDHGAEFFNYKKDDIIFNAEQSKQILEKGKITTGNRRGKALATGTAFADGNAHKSGLAFSGGLKFYKGGSVSSSSNQSANNSSNSNSNSNSNKSSEEEETAFQKLQKRYDDWFNELEHRKNTIEKDIETLEAQNLGVSAKYYDKLIENQQHIFDSYADKLQELRSITPVDADEEREVAQAIRETEEALQDATLAAIEYGKALMELYSTGFDDLTDAYNSKLTLKDDQFKSLENFKELLEIEGDIPTKGLFDEMIARQEEGIKINEALLVDQNKTVEALMSQENPYTVDSEAWESFEDARDRALIAAREGARETKLAIDEQKISVANLKEEYKQLYLTVWDNTRKAYSNKDTYYENQQKLAESYASRLDVLGISVPDEVTDELIRVQKLRQSNKEADFLNARKNLMEIEKQFGADSQEYIDAYLEASGLYQEWYDGETKILEYEQKLIDNRFERFNQIIERVNNSIDDLSNISDLISDKDVANEDGSWTDEGMTQLGISYQQMEYNKQLIGEYANEIDSLNELYANGEISEEKYYERMQDLEDGQWDAINAYKDSKDAIVELNEARIDMIEDGIDKEIDAYSELIELKQEELDAERDLYGFKKSTEKELKNISALERRIASMSGSTDAATVAERTRLEKELREAKDSLSDSYYDHALDAKSTALDDELEAFEKGGTDYVESLRESIKDTETLIANTYEEIASGGYTVLLTLQTLSDEYGFSIDSNLTAPWVNAIDKSLDFETYATDHIANVASTIENRKTTLSDDLSAPWEKQTDIGGPIYQYSWYAAEQMDAVITHSIDDAKLLEDELSKPWENVSSTIDQYVTDATKAIDRVIEREQKAVDAISTAPASNSGGSVVSSDNIISESNEISKYDKVYAGNATIYTTSTGGGPGSQYFKSDPYYIVVDEKNGYYLVRHHTLKSTDSTTGWFKKSDVTKAYAKGTMGTKQDQWAITDESWLGEEITLAAGKHGQLQYLKKGSAVLPADISANLVEWGKLNPNMMNLSNAGANVNMINNAVSKPELNLSFDSLVHVDNCSQETLKDLEKMVDTKITQFNKQLNQSLRRFK